MNSEQGLVDWNINPLCDVILGFRNYTTHATRSRYISFSIRKQPEMCKVLIDFAKKRISSNSIENYSGNHIECLVDYGFLVPVNRFTRFDRIRNRLRFLNENRLTIIRYKEQDYVVMSFVFMAFYRKDANGYIREKAILPHWFAVFPDQVYELITNEFKYKPLSEYTACQRKKFIKYGLIAKSFEIIRLEEFFTNNCKLRAAVLQNLPSNYINELEVSIDAVWSINPNIFISIIDRELPEFIISSLFDLQWIEKFKPNVCVANPITGAISMYWLDKERLLCLERLRSGLLAADDLDEETQKLFNLASIVYKDHQLDVLKNAFERKIGDALRQIQLDGIVVFQAMLSPLELAMTRMYMQYIAHNNYLIADKANGKTKHRYWIHSDNFISYIQYQISQVINQFVRNKVKPGHNALSVYLPGAVLPKHQDDVLAFRWVLSLPIETFPHKQKQEAWPIYVETMKGVSRRVLLQDGDGLLIDPQMPHWRDKLEDHRLNILFLWFVEKHYKGYVNGTWID